MVDLRSKLLETTSITKKARVDACAISSNSDTNNHNHEGHHTNGDLIDTTTYTTSSMSLPPPRSPIGCDPQLASTSVEISHVSSTVSSSSSVLQRSIIDKSIPTVDSKSISQLTASNDITADHFHDYTLLADLKSVAANNCPPGIPFISLSSSTPSQATSPSISAVTRSKCSEVVIIGGGISALLTLVMSIERLRYSPRLDYVTNFTIVESGSYVGSKSSGRGGGLLTPGAFHPGESAILHESARVSYEQWKVINQLIVADGMSMGYRDGLNSKHITYDTLPPTSDTNGLQQIFGPLLPHHMKSVSSTLPRSTAASNGIYNDGDDGTRVGANVNDTTVAADIKTTTTTTTTKQSNVPLLNSIIEENRIFNTATTVTWECAQITPPDAVKSLLQWCESKCNGQTNNIGSLTVHYDQLLTNVTYNDSNDSNSSSSGSIGNTNTSTGNKSVSAITIKALPHAEVKYGTGLRQIKCDKLLIAAGPWSYEILTKIFGLKPNKNFKHVLAHGYSSQSNMIPANVNSKDILMMKRVCLSFP